MRLRYAPLAIRHLHAIYNYIAERSPQAAVNVSRRIQGTIGLLDSFPYIGRAGARRGTREIKVPNLPYVVVHRVSPNGTIVILGVYHTAQWRPGQKM